MTSQLTLEQKSCEESGNCPKVKSCKDNLIPIKKPNDIIMPFTPDNDAHYSRINADMFFNNTDERNCPVTKCAIRQPDCKTNYTGGVYVDEKSPFGVFAYTQYPKGLNDPICLVCGNKDTTQSIQTTFVQLDCNVTGNCQEAPKAIDSDTKGPCSGTLDHVKIPKEGF